MLGVKAAFATAWKAPSLLLTSFFSFTIMAAIDQIRLSVTIPVSGQPELGKVKIPFLEHFRFTQHSQLKRSSPYSLKSRRPRPSRPRIETISGAAPRRLPASGKGCPATYGERAISSLTTSPRCACFGGKSKTGIPHRIHGISNPCSTKKKSP
jgi:hypothetical protein